MKYLPDQKIKDILHLYCVKELGINSISKLVKVSSHKVYYCLGKNNVDLRDQNSYSHKDKWANADEAREEYRKK